MKKFLVSDVARWVLSVFGTTLVASGIVYAATITDVRMQTIVQGDTIGVGWYQSVNDRLAAFSGTGSSGSSLLPCFYAPTQTIVTHGTTYVVYMKPQPSGDNGETCATRTTTCSNGAFTYPVYTSCQVQWGDQGGPP